MRVEITALSAMLVALTACQPGNGPAPPPSRVPSIVEQATPPMNHGDTGPVYVDAAGNDVLRVLSEGPQRVAVKHLASGVVHDMAAVPAASGARYESADGFFLWSKGNEASFGRGEDTLHPTLTLRKHE
ncbi:MAG: MliC family protein [Pseudoxanthomonas suwonensis]|nr:MliC family protein [Pseudoxanthomonas suwonensis]